MHKWCITIILGQISVHVSLDCGVGPKVDGTARSNSHQVGAQTLEKSCHTFVDKDEPEKR